MASSSMSITSRAGRSSWVTSRPTKLRQGSHPAVLDGHGDGRPVAALAGGAVITARRDLSLITTLVADAACRKHGLLGLRRGLASYVTVFVWFL